MKIAYFLDIANGVGGAGTLLLKRAALMAREFDVVVVVPCDVEGRPNEEYICRCERKNLVYKTLFYKTSFNFYDIDLLCALECVEIIKKFIIEEKINFLHSVQLNLAVEMAARELGIPHLMDCYQLRPEEFRLAWEDIYPRYHLCDSELYSKLWEKNLKIESRWIRPVAPKNEIQKKTEYSSGIYNILMLGWICKKKNQLAAIKAIEKCAKKYPVKLTIAGYLWDPYAEYCKEYIAKNNLEEYITMAGFVSDVTELLEQSDCLLCASMDESFPSSIVEAVTYDLTIISTPVAGVPELFVDRENAFISKDFSEDSICESIEDCLRAYQNEMIINIHENAKKTWEEHFSPRIIFEQLKEYYGYMKQDDKQPSMQGSVDIKAVDAEVLGTYDMIRKVCLDNDFECTRAMYYTLLRKTIKGGKAYIWGAGKYGRMAFLLIKALGLKLNLAAFIDRVKTGSYCDLPIIQPDDFTKERADYVFIGLVFGREDCISYLEKIGYEYNKDVYILP